MLLDLKLEQLRIEGDGGIDIIDNVADANGGHFRALQDKVRAAVVSGDRSSRTIRLPAAAARNEQQRQHSIR
jgi:hypothetical protein